MTRTPDEIKKGLECCLGDTHAYHCDECPYADDESEVDDGCGDNGIQLLEDALALIQQLQAENAQQARCIENMTDKLNAMNDEVAKLQAERDAAFENIRGDCKHCATMPFSLQPTMTPEECFDCANKGYYRWEWRGVQKEESDDGKE